MEDEGTCVLRSVWLTALRFPPTQSPKHATITKSRRQTSPALSPTRRRSLASGARPWRCARRRSCWRRTSACAGRSRRSRSGSCARRRRWVGVCVCVGEDWVERGGPARGMGSVGDPTHPTIQNNTQNPKQIRDEVAEEMAERLSELEAQVRRYREERQSLLSSGASRPGQVWMWNGMGGWMGVWCVGSLMVDPDVIHRTRRRRARRCRTRGATTRRRRRRRWRTQAQQEQGAGDGGARGGSTGRRWWQAVGVGAWGRRHGRFTWAGCRSMRPR